MKFRPSQYHYRVKDRTGSDIALSPMSGEPAVRVELYYFGLFPAVMMGFKPVLNTFSASEAAWLGTKLQLEHKVHAILSDAKLDGGHQRFKRIEALETKSKSVCFRNHLLGAVMFGFPLALYFNNSSFLSMKYVPRDTVDEKPNQRAAYVICWREYQW